MVPQAQGGLVVEALRWGTVVPEAQGGLVVEAQAAMGPQGMLVLGR